MGCEGFTKDLRSVVSYTIAKNGSIGNALNERSKKCQANKVIYHY
jgi:hypothetical protein